MTTSFISRLRALWRASTARWRRSSAEPAEPGPPPAPTTDTSEVARDPIEPAAAPTPATATTSDSPEDSAFKSIAANIAKWLVPSATVLFAAIGYLIAAAQSSLLGVELPANPTVYAEDASEFLHEIPRLLGQTLEAMIPHFCDIFGPDWGLWALTVALCAVAFTLPARRHEADDPARRSDYDWMRPAALAVLVALKFTALDLPLGKIQDVVVSHDSTTSAEEGKAALQAALRDEANATQAANGSNDQASFSLTERTQAYQESFIARMAKQRAAPPLRPISDWFERRSQMLWDDVLCSRVALEDPQDRYHKDDVLGCHPHRDGYVWRRNGAFLLQLAMTGAIAALAVALLRRPGTRPAAIGGAILALLYCLTLANAYGKLIKRTEFDFGVIRVAKPPTAEAAPATSGTTQGQPPPSSPAPAQPVTPAQVAVPAVPDEIDGLVLNRDGGGTEFLRLETGRCGTAKSDFATARLAWLSAAQVLSIQEIYRQDVITWAAYSEKLCPESNVYPKAETPH